MYNLSGLIPSRFLSLIAHLTITITLLWGSHTSVMSCLPPEPTDDLYKSTHNQLIIGLSITLGLIAFELISFLTGVTMFHSTSALLSICCHCSASIALTYFILDDWQCIWFWWLFAFCSVLPAFFDLCAVEEESISSTKSGWTFWLLITGFATTIGGSLPVGYNIGVLNSPAGVIKQFCNESIYSRYDVEVSETELNILWSTIVSIFLVGGVTGSLTGASVANRVGRKGAFAVSVVLHIIGGIAFYSAKPANSIELLLLGRLLVGLAAGIVTCAIPMYLIEIAPLALRGSVGVFCPLGITFGVLVAQVIGLRDILGTESLWPNLLAFYVILVILCGMTIPFLPESPKYLYVVRNQPQLALRQLSKIRGLPQSSLSDETYDLQIAQRNEEQTGASWGLLTVLKDKELLLPILLVISMQAGQQLNGINAVFYYSVSIFESTGLSELQSQLANIGCGCINLLMAIIAIPLMSKVNRRTLFLLSASTTAFWLILLGLSIYFIDKVSWMPYVSIVSILSYVLFYGLGMGPIPYFVGSELFDVGPRPPAMALGSMANWGANFIVGMTFPTLQAEMGPWVFFIFAGITIGLFFFIRYYLPETRGKDPNEIANLCKNGLNSKPLESPTSSLETSTTVPISDGVKSDS